MPSLRDAFAALLVQTASAEVNPEAQFFAFPNFYYPVDAQDLNLGDPDAAYAFALQANIVPESSPQFILSARFVWEVYEELLAGRVLPLVSGEPRGHALRFTEAVARLGDPLMSPDEQPFYATPVMPVNPEDPGAWTPVSVDAGMIRQLAPQLSPAHREWLSRFNFLGKLGDEVVEAVSLERLSVVILRPWFDPSVFTWRFWDLPGPPVSDGAENPRGRLPGVIAKLVLVRNLRVKLAATLPPDVGPAVVFRHVGGAGGPGGDAPSAPAGIAGLVEVAGAGGQAERARVAFKAFGGSKAPPADRVKALEAELADGTGAAGAGAGGGDEGAQKFHVPFTFDVTATRNHVAGLLAAASTAKASHEADVAKARQEIHRLTEMRANPPVVRDHRRGPRVPFDPTQRIEQELAAAQGRMQQADQERSRAAGEETRLAHSISVLDQLAGVQPDPRPYVLACVCDRIPKSPDPDPALFSPAPA